MTALSSLALLLWDLTQLGVALALPSSWPLIQPFLPYPAWGGILTPDLLTLPEASELAPASQGFAEQPCPSGGRHSLLTHNPLSNTVSPLHPPRKPSQPLPPQAPNPSAKDAGCHLLPHTRFSLDGLSRMLTLLFSCLPCCHLSCPSAPASRELQPCLQTSHWLTLGPPLPHSPGAAVWSKPWVFCEWPAAPNSLWLCHPMPCPLHDLSSFGSWDSHSQGWGT